MKEHAAIAIYNASAGSGKTFTLVSEYLTILFKSNNRFKYRNILAITFTNKAVAEMKTRVIESLKEFSQLQSTRETPILFQHIQENTALSKEALIAKSQQLLRDIIQDYASFDIVTIDAFTQRIVRTFARELKIPQQFDVELNTEEVIAQAVDNLIAKVGEDEKISEVLIHYAIDKINDDKSWDITANLLDKGKLLLNENHRVPLASLRKKSLDDFDKLIGFFGTAIKEKKNTIATTSQELIDLFRINGLEPKNFNRSSLPNNLKKLANQEFKALDLTANWAQNTLKGESLYTKSQDQEIKDSIDRIKDTIVSKFTTITLEIRSLWFYEELLKNITPLSVLQAIQKEVDSIKADKNIVLISDFNEVINKTIVGQPTPFIYERLGERYQNYFIDEFQDTSSLQWHNLIPLIDGAVQSHNEDTIPNSLMLVGDPKQAIYRWRGGYAEQFIAISHNSNPFTNPNKKTFNLETNWRSYDTLITFNNDFFTTVADNLSNVLYKDIFISGNKQQVNTKKGGYVNISFIEGKNKADREPIFLEHTLQTVLKAQENYSNDEICILVRGNNEGKLIAQYLQEHKVQVISNDSLLLSQSVQIKLIVNILKYIQNNEKAQEISIHILEYLAEYLFKIEDQNNFFINYLKLEGQTLFDQLKSDFNLDFNLEKTAGQPLYEAVEYIARSFDLFNEGGIYLQYFLDVVFEFTQKNQSGIPGFLDWWERNKEKASIKTTAGTNAVEIMTIHKSKGLEFPVVIYPFAESDITNRDENWIQLDPAAFQGFETLQISQKRDLTLYNEDTKALYYEILAQQQLDNFNVLYVALTRAVEQLYILTSVSDLNKVRYKEDPKAYNDLFINYLITKGYWDEVKTSFDFGSPQRMLKREKISEKQIPLHISGSAKEDHKLKIVTPEEYLYDDTRILALQQGNNLHELFALIQVETDLDRALAKAIEQGLILTSEKDFYTQRLNTLIKELKTYGFFNKEHIKFIERDLLYQGETIRPDRVEVNSDNKAYLLDYKTGKREDTHVAQLDYYASALKSLGYDIDIKILVYLNDPSPLYVVN